MASITTQTVGAASATVATTAVNAARVVVAVSRPEQAKRLTEEADKVTITSSSTEDDDRSPAEPKRTEATYSAPKHKRPK